MEDQVRAAVAAGDVSAYEQVLRVLVDEGSGETSKAAAAQLLAAHWNAFPAKSSAVVEALLAACEAKNANSVRIHSIIALSNVVKQAKEPLTSEDMDKISVFTKDALSVENRGVLVRHLTGLSKLIEGPKPESSTQVSTEGGGRLGKKELPVPPSPYLMLRHFPRETTNNMLYDYFSAIEPSVKISLHTPPNGHSHAFINFSSTEKATAAITYCRNQPFRNGYRLNAMFARGRSVLTVDFHRVGSFPTDWSQHTALWDSTVEQLEKEYPKKWTVRSPGVVSFESKDICQHLVQFGLLVTDTQLFVVYNAAEQRREDKAVPPYRSNDFNKHLNSPARTNSPQQPLDATNKQEPLENGEVEAGEINDNKNDTTVGASELQENKNDRPTSWGPPSRNEQQPPRNATNSSWGPPSRPAEIPMQQQRNEPPRNEVKNNRSAERPAPGKTTLGALARSNNRSPPRPQNRSRSRESRRGGPPRRDSPPRGRPPARSRSKESFRPNSRGNSRERRDGPPPMNRNRETLRDKANRQNNRSRSREPARRPASPPRRGYSPPRQPSRRPRSPPRRPNLPPSPGRPSSPGYRGSPMAPNGSPRPPSRDFREEPRKDEFARREEGRDEPRNAWQRSRSREAKPSSRPREVERTNLEGTTRDNRSLADIARVGGADVIARNSPRPAPSKPEVAVSKDNRSLAEIAAAAAAITKRPRSPSPPKEVIADRQQPDYSNVVFDPLPTDADDVPRRVVSPSPAVVAGERSSPVAEDKSNSLGNILNPKPPAPKRQKIEDLDELAVDYEDDDE
ncbi:hypothetical protein THRCLA_05582 [Thraustotheca clavata]|uniref:RRM domain-containing protein n=1 Tax=Thraustotheca clavata TaxID=74557 RepID=A0A1V9ZVL6_9STRA|nr:hypothetical protein THRCLA_05582 [Thraustotheca clavata]